MTIDRNAEEARAPLVLADRQQRAAERRAQQERHDANCNGEDREGEVIERLVVVENIERGKAEMQRLTVPGRQAIVTAGEIAPLEGDEIEHLAEGDGAHGEIDPAQANDQRPDDRRSRGAEHDAESHRQRRAFVDVLHDHGGAVGAKTEISGMAERQHAGVAKQEIQRHGRKRVDQDHSCPVRHSRRSAAARTGR